MVKNRYACLSDLNNYFPKRELLSGLTEIEKIQLRQNIGILNYTGEGGQSTPVEISYSDLNNMATNNLMIVGARYIITDYQTIYASNVLNGFYQKVTWGTTGSANPSPVMPLLVIANTSSKLDSRAQILTEEAKNWVVEYDLTKEILQDGISTKGKITYLKDNHGNSAHYDFKNIKFRRTNIELANSNLNIDESYIDLYTFSDVENGIVLENSDYETTKYNTLGEGCWNNVFIGDTYNNLFGEGCWNNTFLRGCHDNTIKWNSVGNLFNENVCYTTGSIYNKKVGIGNTSLSMTLTKTIQKVNDVTLISFLDPITYAYQIIFL